MWSSLRSHFFRNERAQQPGGPVSPPISKDLSRRCFVQTAVAVTAGTLIPLGADAAVSRRAFQTTLSPEAALNELIEGNQRYVTGV
jgi:hypothetical protein